MTHQPETARELLHRHGLPEDIIDGALCLHAQELAALQRLRMDELDLTGQKARIVGRIVDLIDPTRTPAAVSAAVAPPTQTALRQRIAQALAREDAHNAGYDHGFVGSYGADDETDGFVDAVLAVLPEVADRATVLAEVDRAIRTATGSCGYKAEDGCDFCNGVDAALDQVRRMADETATETPQPSLRDQHRAAWHTLTPDEQAARIAELDTNDEPAAEAQQDETATETPDVYLTTPCDACNHTLNWHSSGETGCTVPRCACARYYHAAGARQDGVDS